MVRGALWEKKKPKEIEAIIRQTLQDYEARYLKTIARTTTMSCYNDSRWDLLQKTRWVVGVRMNSVLDERTTPECEQLHGKFFRKDDPDLGEVWPPGHWNCRRVATFVRDEKVNWDRASEFSHLQSEDFGHRQT